MSAPLLHGAAQPSGGVGDAFEAPSHLDCVLVRRAEAPSERRARVEQHRHAVDVRTEVIEPGERLVVVVSSDGLAGCRDMAGRAFEHSGDGVDVVLSLVDRRGQDLCIDLVDGEQGSEEDAGADDRVHLIVPDHQLGVLVGEHRLDRIVREDHDQVHRSVDQAPTRLGLVLDEPLVGHLIAERVGVLLERIGEDAVGFGHEQRAVRLGLVLVARAEKQQDGERTQHEQGDQPGLTHDVEELLAREGASPNQPRQETPHDGSSPAGAVARNCSISRTNTLS